jgi:hypothetical protein
MRIEALDATFFLLFFLHVFLTKSDLFFFDFYYAIQIDTSDDIFDVDALEDDPNIHLSDISMAPSMLSLGGGGGGVLTCNACRVCVCLSVCRLSSLSICLARSVCHIAGLYTSFFP